MWTGATPTCNKDLSAWQQRGCRGLKWSHSCQQVSSITFEQVCLAQAA